MTRRPTLADVAAAAGVSPSTASVVFSGKAPVADATRTRVLTDLYGTPEQRLRWDVLDAFARAAQEAGIPD